MNTSINWELYKQNIFVLTEYILAFQNGHF